MNSVEYAEYLMSDHWHKFRLEAIENAGSKCSLCAKHKDNAILQVHHNSYENLGHEEPSDVIVLCAECHTKYHDGYKHDQERKYYHNILEEFLEAVAITQTLQEKFPAGYSYKAYEHIYDLTIDLIICPPEFKVTE